MCKFDLNTLVRKSSWFNEPVIATGLLSPSVVAVDSFGEAYVTQEGANNIIRAADKKVVASFAGRATAIAFGVNDLMLIGLYDSNQVFWGKEAGSPSTSVTEPVNIATDATGRVYVAEGAASNARVIRYHQRDPGGQTVVANGLNGAAGIAVDSVGNIFIAEPGASRIVLVTHDQQLFNWGGCHGSTVHELHSVLDSKIKNSKFYFNIHQVSDSLSIWIIAHRHIIF